MTSWNSAPALLGRNAPYVTPLIRNLSGPEKTNFPRIDGRTSKGVLVSLVVHTRPGWPTETADKLHLANFRRPVPMTPRVSVNTLLTLLPGADYPGIYLPIGSFLRRRFSVLSATRQGPHDLPPSLSLRRNVLECYHSTYARLLPTSCFSNVPAESLDFCWRLHCCAAAGTPTNANANHGKFTNPGGV